MSSLRTYFKFTIFLFSAFVKEVLVDRVTSVSTEGLAAHLNKRLKSESFLKAVARLIRHEAHRYVHVHLQVYLEMRSFCIF